VSLPLFLVPAVPTGDAYTLDGPEGHHAAAVQRLRVAELSVTVEKRWYVDPPAPRLVVAQGIPKGDRGELAVQAMTEVGVDEIVPWAASRCVAIWRGDRGTKSRDKWAAAAREAAKQARRPWRPVVADHAATTAALAALAGRSAGTLVLDEAATTPLTSVSLPAAGDIVLVVGPEGGIAPDEVDALCAVGATPVRLGENVLRTSTAGVAALSVLAARLGRW
jgi:16S rRNA (uracil1498-N3)-methyltransferase